MEYWGPGSETPLEYSLNRLKDSTVYIGIIGTRYGTTTECGKSITQLEYEEAEKLGLERLVYIIDENHPVPLKFVDRGESFDKLNLLKRQVSRSVQGKFTSPADLSSQVVTHLVQLFDRIGANVRAAFNKHGIREFILKTGYSFSMEEEGIDITPFIEADSTGTFKIIDEYLASVAASAIIAKNLHNGNFDIIHKLVTFTPKVYRLIPILINDMGIDDGKLAEAIKICTFPPTVRLLIAIAGEIRALSCIEPICKQLFSLQKHHSRIKSYDLQITPFNDIVKIALSKMPKVEIEPILYKYIEYAKEKRAWQAKKTLEWALKN